MYYGAYERLTDDGLTQWHPAFLEMGNTLDECADRYQIASFLVIASQGSQPSASTSASSIPRRKRQHDSINGVVGCLLAWKSPDDVKNMIHRGR